MIRPAHPSPRPWRRGKPDRTAPDLRPSRLRSAFEAYVRSCVAEALADGPLMYHELRCRPELRPIPWRAVRSAVDALVVAGAVVVTEDGDRLDGPHPIRLSRYALAPGVGEGVGRG